MVWRDRRRITMKDRVLVCETEQGTTLRISAPNGESHVFLFFTEPETPEEAAAQAPYKLIQEVFTRGYELGWETRHYESPLRYLVFPAVIVGISLGVFVAGVFGALVGTLLGGATCIALCVVIIRHTNRIEAPINQDHQWFRPVREKLFAFAQANDFRGALGYAIDVTGCTK